MIVRFSMVVVLAVGLSSCGGGKTRYVKRQAAAELGCPEGQVRLKLINKAELQYLATACGRRAVYTYESGEGAVRISAIEGEGAVPAGAVPPPPGVLPPPATSGDVPPPPPPPPPPVP